MDLELGRDRGEGQAFAVTARGGGDLFVGHFADKLASRHVAIIEVVHDGRAMDVEVAGELVDGHPARVLGDEFVDLGR
ncbi:hypothetical protein [Iamia sp.]|uniref:hypothetical protein n=1 Tax=Iamia sp. TaxID=2722710 RepID=UPI002C85E4C9|nr:hypothetical protein [Iamia sp.]HXH56192.1 hypothetical protein [Iamia sp.]